MTEFYLFGNAFRRGALHVMKATSLPAGDALRMGVERPSEPLEFIQHSGTTAMDLIGCTDVSILLCSTNLQRLLEQAHATGWSTFPATIRLRNGDAVYDYRGLQSLGRSGPPNYADMHEEDRPPLFEGAPSRRVFVGMSIDVATWDGSDVFTPESSSFIVVTSKVAQVLQGSASNVLLQDLADVEFAMRPRSIA